MKHCWRCGNKITGVFEDGEEPLKMCERCAERYRHNLNIIDDWVVEYRNLWPLDGHTNKDAKWQCELCLEQTADKSEIDFGLSRVFHITVCNKCVETHELHRILRQGINDLIDKILKLEKKVYYQEELIKRYEDL